MFLDTIGMDARRLDLGSWETYTGSGVCLFLI